MTDQPLPVILACEDLAVDLFQRIEKFPRHHKYALGQQILATVHDILAHLLHARHQTGLARAERLVMANIALDILRFDLRLCLEVRILAPKAQEALLDRCRTVGQQIGGWLRSCQKPERSP